MSGEYSSDINARKDAETLVEMHLQLSDPMDAVIWIRHDLEDLWIVEVLPEYPDDPLVHQPVTFRPSQGVPRRLHLIAGNLLSLQRSIVRLRNFPKWVSEGIVLYQNNRVGDRLIRYAKRYGGHLQ